MVLYIKDAVKENILIMVSAGDQKITRSVEKYIDTAAGGKCN